MRLNKPNYISAQAAAFRIWKELGHPHPSEVDLSDLAQFRDVTVAQGDLSGAEGRLTRMDGKGIIRVNRKIKREGQRRFTIAHELGHWELHKDLNQFTCSENDMKDYSRSNLEIEANFFAAELLMPPKHFRLAINQKKTSISLLKELAQEFNTTLTSTAIRLADDLKRNIIVVWIQNDQIKWSYSTPKKGLLRVLPGSAPIYSSSTLPREELLEGMDYYDQAKWFPQLHNSPEVIEESIKMANLNCCLTLLEVL